MAKSNLNVSPYINCYFTIWQMYVCYKIDTRQDGTTYKNPKYFQLLEEKLLKIQSVLSRRAKVSPWWDKQQVKVSRMNELMDNFKKACTNSQLKSSKTFVSSLLCSCCRY